VYIPLALRDCSAKAVMRENIFFKNAETEKIANNLTQTKSKSGKGIAFFRRICYNHNIYNTVNSGGNNV